MKPYGVSKKDRGCCPGHDRYPRETYSNKRSKRAKRRDTKIAHRVERHKIRACVRQEASACDDES